MRIASVAVEVMMPAMYDTGVGWRLGLGTIDRSHAVDETERDPCGA